MDQKKPSLTYIRAKTAEYTQIDLQNGLIVTPDVCDKNDGQHPETGRDLETPTSYINEMVQVWTSDMGYSTEEEAEIEALVYDVVTSNITEELKRFL